MKNIPNPWKFNQNVASEYESHVLKHIPLYEKTIDFCLDFASKNTSYNSPILDFGCATGCTLRKFKSKGWSNLWGVDKSSDMFKLNQDGIVRYSTTLVDQYYSLSLVNWTLHFCENKWDILDKILSLSNWVILSEKTLESTELKNEYYSWKQAQGCTLEEIKAKEQSLKEVMWLNDPKDYLKYPIERIVHSQFGFYTYLIKGTHEIPKAIE